MIRQLNFLKLDLRSLSLARVALATVLIIDLMYRLCNLTDFYTDYGVIPRGPMITQIANPYFFSLLFVAGKSVYMYILFLLGFIAYLGFFFGYKTKLSNIAAWIFFVSLSARTPIVTQGGDDLMRLAIFWMIFLPSETYYSIDSALRNFEKGEKINAPVNLLNISSFAFLTQLILMYFFTAILKWHPIWHSEGTALYYALELDQFLTPLGFWFRKLPFDLLKLLTFVTFYVELILPIMVFSPIKNSFFRWLGILTFFGFHLSLYLLFELGNFPWVCMAYWLAFIPGEFWSKFDVKLKQWQTGYILYYDPDCRICKKMCNIIDTFLFLKYVEIKPGSDPTIHNKMLELNSWVLQAPDQKLFFRFDVFVNLLNISPFKFLAPIFKFQSILNIGDTIYKIVSNDRKGKLSFFAKLKPYKNFNENKFWIQGLVCVFFLIAIYWNIALLKKDDDVKITKTVDVIGSVFRLHQFWSMFAPYPAMEDGWVITDAELLNGKKWDIFHDKEVSYEKPEKVSSMFKNSMWRKYLINLRQNDYYDYRLYFGRYLCRKWNEEHQGDEKVNTFKIYYLLERNQPPGDPQKPIEQEMLWSHGCFIK